MTKQPKPKFTQAVLQAFRRYEELTRECTCRVGSQWKPRPCAACEERTTIEAVLQHELGLPPWERAIQHPNTVSPYPKGSHADKGWKSKSAAQARYLALEAACDAKDGLIRGPEGTAV
jgi:hypothetical protein